MAKSVTRNYLYHVTYQLLVIVLPLITTPYISRVLGVQQIGIFSYVNTVVTYFIMIPQFGLNLYGRRQIAYVRDDREKTTNLFWQLMCIRLINFSFALLLYGVMIGLTKRYVLYYGIFTISIIANALDITWFYQAFEEFGIITVRNFLIKILNMVGIFIFVHSADSLWKYMLIMALGEMIAQTAMWFGLKRKVLFRRPTLRGAGKHVKGALVMFLPQIITTIYTLTDKLMLGLWSTETEVGLYSQSEKIIRLTLAIIGSMGAVAMPRISNDFANGRIANIVERLSRNRTFVFFLGAPLMWGIWGISAKFVPWFFGKGYDAVSYLMVIISPIIILIALSDLYGTQYLIPTGQMREYTISTVGGATINVILNYLLIRKYAAVGVSIATVVSEFTVTAFMWGFARKHIQLKKAAVWRYWIVAIIMGLAVKAVDIYNPDSPFWTFGEILLGTVIYGGILLVLKDNMAMSIMDKLREIIRVKLG